MVPGSAITRSILVFGGGARWGTRPIGADSFPRISNPRFPSASRAFDVALPDRRASFSSFVVSMPYLIRKLDRGSYPIQSDEQLSRLPRRQHVGNPQLVETHVVKAEIRDRPYGEPGRVDDHPGSRLDRVL